MATIEVVLTDISEIIADYEEGCREAWAIYEAADTDAEEDLWSGLAVALEEARDRWTAILVHYSATGEVEA